MTAIKKHYLYKDASGELTWHDHSQGVKPGSAPAEYWSHNLGVNPNQITELRSHLEKHGLESTEIRGDGAVKIRSNGHRNRLLSASGMHDRDACYRQRTK